MEIGINKTVFHSKDIYRWSVINICNEGSPPYSYSSGFYKAYNHPEVIIFGLHAEAATRTINLIGEKIVRGICFASDTVYKNIFSCSNCVFQSVPYPQYTYFMHDGYDFPLFQLVWSDFRGFFPWERDFSEELATRQLILANGIKQGGL